MSVSPSREKSAAQAGGLFASLRFSGFTLLVLGALLAAVLILLPSLSTYIAQQREIAAVQASVKESRERLAEVDAERAKWRDPAYVRAQARERLFYVMPGETQLNVIADVVLPLETEQQTSKKLTEISGNWALALAGSFLQAGVSPAPVAQDVPAADAGGSDAGEQGAQQSGEQGQ